jgi:hypothetical protein
VKPCFKKKKKKGEEMGLSGVAQAVEPKRKTRNKNKKQK